MLMRYLKAQGIVLLCDPRHGLTELDDILLDVIRPRVEEGLKFLVLLTKADKLASGARKAQLNVVREAALGFAGDVQVELFSSLKKIGVDKVRQKLDSWFNTLEPAYEDQDAEA